MSSLNDSAPIFRYHRDMIALHGNEGTYALGWRDKYSQTIRFEVLAGIADLNDRSVLDAGCGHGDLCAYLSKLYARVKYSGVEQIPELLNEAIRRYAKWPAVNFFEGNFNVIDLPAADYVMASGSLNYRSVDPEFIFKAIARLYSACKLGLAFNLLSHIPTNGLLVAYNTEGIMAYCQSLCPTVILKDTYTEEDFTVFMYR